MEKITATGPLASSPLAEDRVSDRGGRNALSSEAIATLNSDIKALIQSLMERARIPGLSIGVVHPDSSTELASWGIRTEGGDPMTSDVSSSRVCKTRSNNLKSCFIGSFQYSVLLQGVPFGRDGYSHGRFRSRS